MICVIGQNENDVSVSVYACLFKTNTFSLVYGCRCGYLCGFVCKKNPIGPDGNNKRRGEPALECNSSVKAAEWAVMLRDHWKSLDIRCWPGKRFYWLQFRKYLSIEEKAQEHFTKPKDEIYNNYLAPRCNTASIYSRLNRKVSLKSDRQQLRAK